MKKLLTILMLMCSVVAWGQYEEGQELINKAESGNTEAQGRLARGYFNGYNGVEKNYEKAFKWAKIAAEKGDAKAQYVLGSCYMWGEGVAEDEAEGERWLRKAAAQGDEPSMFTLGIHYKLKFDLGLHLKDNKDELKDNKEEAIYWFKKDMDTYFAKYGEEHERTAEQLRELGVYYHPDSKTSSTAATSGTSTTTREISSSSNASSSSSSAKQNGLLAKGDYTINSQGQTRTGYTEFIGSDFTVTVEFYSDRILVNGITCKYVGINNGWKRYDAPSLNMLGGSTKDSYFVDSNFNMRKETFSSTQFGADTFTYTMAKGVVSIPKNQPTTYGNSGGGGSNSNSYSSGSNSNGTRSSSSQRRCTKLSVSDIAHCGGSGVCAKCNGKKRYYDTSYGIYKWVDPCVTCGGTGKCPSCGGTGYR